MYLLVIAELPDNIILSMQKMENGDIQIIYNSNQAQNIERVSGYNDTTKIIDNCIRPVELRTAYARKVGRKTHTVRKRCV